MPAAAGGDSGFDPVKKAFTPTTNRVGNAMIAPADGINAFNGEGVATGASSGEELTTGLPES